MNKEDLVKLFAEYNIDMRPLFYPVSAMPPFKSYVTGKKMSNINPISYALSEYGICLPNGNNLTTDDVKYICDIFKKILNNK